MASLADAAREPSAAPPGNPALPAASPGTIPARISHIPILRSHTPIRLPFDHLGEHFVRLPYEVLGPAVAPATVVLGGISAGRHLAATATDRQRGWWPGVVAEGGALDPLRHRLVGIDYLGGRSRAGLLRPVTTHDQARAIAAVLDDLGVAEASLVGASYGGMVALAFAELFPERVRRLVVLCAAHRTHPMATALRALQRSAASLGAASGQEGRGVALARALAMTTYRSAQEFEERFDSAALTPGLPGKAPARFPVEEYLDARGADFVQRFDADRFLALSESIDLHRTRPASLPSRTLLVSVDSDFLVPPWLVDELVDRSGGAAGHVTIPSPFGHDAFLKEVGRVSRIIESSLCTPEEIR
ncbi:MAG: homoserine O-succinyltransferase [Gemmatimonadetes bacterium]|nr:homoserine O-succinyltransferase [Gemmatimonadota bacterium]